VQGLGPLPTSASTVPESVESQLMDSDDYSIANESDITDPIDEIVYEGLPDVMSEHDTKGGDVPWSETRSVTPPEWVYEIAGKDDITTMPLTVSKDELDTDRLDLDWSPLPLQEEQRYPNFYIDISKSPSPTLLLQPPGPQTRERV
jgi:hypothetical protein